ncbi:MAG: sensor histidine kinase [Thiobacillus sp.]
MAFDNTAFQAALIHELKNHLGLLGMTLERLSPTGDPAHDIPLDDARLLCQSVSDRLRQALWMYRADQGPLALNVDAYSPHELVRGLAARAQSLAREHFDVSVELAADLPAIAFFDRDLLEMALMNGIHNSLVYARARIVIFAALRNGWLELGVRDDSEGYPRELLDSLANGVPYRARGTGLGLLFSRLIAQLHENRGRTGELVLENSPGAVFTLRLP